MNHIETNQQRNMQPRLLHRQVLQAVQILHLELPKHRTHLPFDDGSVRLFLGQPCDQDSRSLVQLASLLFHRHLLQQGFGAAVRVVVRER